MNKARIASPIIEDDEENDEIIQKEISIHSSFEVVRNEK